LEAHTSNTATATSSSSSSTPTATSSSSSSISNIRQLDEALGKFSYRMIITYDGTAYSGWQLQIRAPTIQAQIERALSTVLRVDRKTLCVCAAGRTDAGVHARGQVRPLSDNAAADI
jgi:hypothetical protein